MKLELSIELKARTARRIAVCAVTVLVFGAVAIGYGAQLRFTGGATLTAEQLNNNFDELYASVARPTAGANGKTISVNALLCGATDDHDGDLGGYAGAKAMCEATCSSPSAHMCDASEVLRTAALGLTIGTGWYSSASPATDSFPAGAVTGVYRFNDCQGWTANTVPQVDSGNVGPAWLVSYGSGYTCNQPAPVLCCD